MVDSGGYSAGYGGNTTTSADVLPSPGVLPERASKDDTKGVVLGSIFGGVAALAAIYLVVCCGGWAFRAAWREAWSKGRARRRGTRQKGDVEAQAPTSEQAPTVASCSYSERQRNYHLKGGDTAEATAEVAAAWPQPSTATRS